MAQPRIKIEYEDGLGNCSDWSHCGIWLDIRPKKETIQTIMEELMDKAKELIKQADIPVVDKSNKSKWAGR